MNKKQFLWFLLAAVIFVGAGWFGVRSAVNARQEMAAYSQQAANTFASVLTGGAKSAGYEFPDGPYVARVDVEGTILSQSAGVSGIASGGGYDHEGLLAYVEALIHDENNVGMLLFVDSPGGEMGAADELYLKLMDYKATGRPIWCYFDSTACSGGYYVAMAADEIQANRNCMCVNIGVYIATYNLSGLFEKLGVEQIAFKSSENKGIGMGGLPWTEEQKEIYQTMIDLMYDQFLDVVAHGAELTSERLATIEKDRSELSGDFCRSCGYCMPCPVGIKINNCARIMLMLRRAPMQNWVSEEWQAEMRKIENCLHCYQCASKCPFGLDTPRLLEDNYREYKKFIAERNR